MTSSQYEHLAARILSQDATAGVIGLGYVGLPLAVASAAAGFRTLGFDIDSEKVHNLNGGNSYIEAVSDEALRRAVSHSKFSATTNFERLSECDVIMICVPTPLLQHREPDLSFVIATGQAIAENLRKGQLIVLESTTYPGTTEEVIIPILESSGLKSGQDFFVGFSPEREDPGNHHYRTKDIPKVIGGTSVEVVSLLTDFYGAIVSSVIPVSSIKTAEAVKITENVFRAVNIALVNELKVVFHEMGIDIWEIVDAASTKPFGFMPFYPGPGLGGHCIPIDPFYLTWKAREFGITTKFIELAGEINLAMPSYVLSRLELELDLRQSCSLSAAKILVIGIAYKKNVPDMRESPALVLFDLLEKRGTKVDYHDPLVPRIPNTREHPQLAGRSSVDLNETAVAEYNAVLVATDHDQVDYELLARSARLLIDTRNVMSRKGLNGPQISKA